MAKNPLFYVRSYILIDKILIQPALRYTGVVNGVRAIFGVPTPPSSEIWEDIPHPQEKMRLYLVLSLKMPGNHHKD